MTWKEKIMDYVSKFPGATDSDIARYYNSERPDKLHQTINAACRELEKSGMIVRKSNPDKGNNIGNYPVEEDQSMNMTWKERVMYYVKKYPGATDSDIENHYKLEYPKVTHQTINIACRDLVRLGMLVRQNNPDKSGLIGNYPTDKAPEIAVKAKTEPRLSDGEPLQEEDIKHILTDKLTSEGWNVKTAWGYTRGVDIDARRGVERWLIEIKGPGSRNEMRNNYFIGILGEMLQRMDDPNARYTIAFPDIEKFRRLWNDLPELAKKRTTIDLLLVDPQGNIENLK